MSNHQYIPGTNMPLPLIGQKAVIRGGGSNKGYIGVVVDYCFDSPRQDITVEHPLTRVASRYDYKNVALVGVPYV